MPTVLLMLLSLAPAQDTNFVPRVSKDTYLSAVRELRRAVDLISDDPGVAVEKITSLLANSKIRFTECILKIEVAPQEFQYENYFPYQVRGKARMAQAKKIVAGSPDGAVTLLLAAIEDFKVSAGKKVPGNDELQKAADKELIDARKRVPKDDPIDEFRRSKFDPLIRNRKFKSAVNVVNGDDGKVLTEEQRRSLVSEAEGACATFVGDQLFKIRGYLGDIGSLRLLKDLGDSQFKSQFTNQVPPEGELTDNVAKDPTLAWVRKHIKTLRSIQLGQAKPEEVFAAAGEGIATEAADTEGENPWFKAMAIFGSNMVEEVITSCTEKSEKLLKADRAKLQAEAERSHAAWKAFVEKTDKKVQERHPDLGERSARLDRSVKAFPAELTQLASFDIERPFEGDPAKELNALEESLRNLVSDLAGMGRVAIESRQELYTKLITVGAWRRFIANIPDDQIVRDFTDFKVGLRNAGGPLNPEQYGPRVKKIFDGLK
jgi:hypothetical protein